MTLKLFILLVIMAVVSIWIYKGYRRRIDIWIPAYLKGVFVRGGAGAKSGKTKHIMFLFVNHFEAPLGERMIGDRRIAEWAIRYPVISSRHRDSDGVCPQHTWFYAAEKFDIDHKQAAKELRIISDLCNRGFGEIEFHIHHQDDTSVSLKDKINRGVDTFNRFGALITNGNEFRKTFGFIHGGWALDNSIAKNGKNCCGVNNELEILKAAGCYADFTFPAFSFSAQPRKINSIYYAVDDPVRPKSYDSGIDVEVGKRPSGDLMIIEGPLSISWKDWRNKFYPKMEYGDICKEDPPSASRIDQWIRCNIHVKARPEWVFVKIYCHGCYDETMEVVLGEKMHDMFRYLESRYNDGAQYKLHYVTSREAYNIIKAAEDGKTGNPGEYRDYVIGPYKNTS